jgi:DnaJ family protein A protein 2
MKYNQFGMSAFDKGATMDTNANFGDLLNQIFSGGMGGMDGIPGMGGRAHGSGRPGRFQRKPRGKDVVQNYEISLEDLYNGRTVKLASTRNRLCTICISPAVYFFILSDVVK